MRKVIRGIGIVGVIALALSVMVNAAGPAPVADAVMKRDAEAVRTLIKGGADVNAAQGDGMTALHWAARNGDVEHDAAAAVCRRQRQGQHAAGRLHAAAAGGAAGPRRRSSPR